MGPFLVRSQGWFAAPGTGEVYLALDYSPGGDVELLVDREGSLNAGAARFYAGCLALALEALHEHNIVHRDVKPDNLCIGADGYARVVDLAYAKSVPTANGRAHTLLGTPEYLAPEAFQGHGHGKEADMWAYGISLYVMLVAAHPWDAGESPQHLYANVLAQPPFFPQFIVPRAAKVLVEQCLHREAPAARPTARSLWASDFFVHALPPSAPRGGLDRDELLAKRVPPPFVPRLPAPLDTRYFRPAEESDSDDDDDDGAGGAQSDAGTHAVVAVVQPGGEQVVAVRGRPGGGVRGRDGARVDLTLAAGAEDLQRYRAPADECASLDAFVAPHGEEWSVLV